MILGSYSWELGRALPQDAVFSLLFLVCCANGYAVCMLIGVRDVPCALAKQTRGPPWLG